MLFGQKVFSTGLLVVQATSITVHDAVFMKSAAFDAGLWNTSFSYGANSIPLWSAIQWENLTRPSWTGETFVFEPFRVRDDQAKVNSIYTAVTKAMYPGIDRDEVKSVREPTYSKDAIGSGDASVIYRSHACDIDQNLDLADPTQRIQRQNRWAAENYMGRVQAGDCPGTKRFLITATQADRNLTITKYRYNHLPYISSGLTCDKALMCRPVHYIRNFLVYIAENGQQRFEPLLKSELKATQLDYLQASLYSYSLRIRLSIHHTTTTIWFLPANPPHVN
jgi:hypothetical protein